MREFRETIPKRDRYICVFQQKVWGAVGLQKDQEETPLSLVPFPALQPLWHAVLLLL